MIRRYTQVGFSLAIRRTSSRIVGLTQAVPAPTGDFQDLPSWRHLVAEHALTLRRFHTATLIAPMTLVNRQYFDEIIGTLREAGEKVRHIFLTCPPTSSNPGSDPR